MDAHEYLFQAEKDNNTATSLMLEGKYGDAQCWLLSAQNYAAMASVAAQLENGSVTPAENQDTSAEELTEWHHDSPEPDRSKIYIDDDEYHWRYRKDSWEYFSGGVWASCAPWSQLKMMATASFPWTIKYEYQ